MKVYAIALNTFREAVRNKLLYSVLFFALLLIGVSAFFGTVTIGDQVKIIADFGFFSLSFFGAVITILSGISLLHKELKEKTIYNILSKPVTRWQFILGKYLGLTATISLLIAIMGLGLIAFLSLFEGEFSLALFQGVLFCLFEVMVIAAVTIFFSAMVVTTTLPALFTFATYLAGRSIEYFSFFFESSTDTSVGVQYLIKILDFMLPDLSVFNVANSIVYGRVVDASYVCYAFGYAVSYSAVLLLLAVGIFSRREML